jgi:hypothetical protein
LAINLCSIAADEVRFIRDVAGHNLFSQLYDDLFQFRNCLDSMVGFSPRLLVQGKGHRMRLGFADVAKQSVALVWIIAAITCPVALGNDSEKIVDPAKPPGVEAASGAIPPAVEAVDFEERIVYRPAKKPAYAAWVSLFPGGESEWYISFEEVYPSAVPKPSASLDTWYRMGLPDGYDKSSLQMDVVLLESKDGCHTWNAISRWPAPYQHSAGSFGACKTRDGRFLRTVWACYETPAPKHSGEILYASSDGGKTWEKQSAMLGDRFAAYPHRMKQLRDGTIVLAVPYQEMWGSDKPLPMRTSTRVEVQNELQMSLYFSSDDGKSWNGPMGIFAGKPVSETDFAELDSGDLLAFNNSIFPEPGRQRIYRTAQGFVPGPYFACEGQTVPECVVMTREGVLVGSMRNGGYYWSDDEGVTWNPLSPMPACGYQPMIRQMDNGQIICAWHRGADDAFADADHVVGLHVFRLKVNRKTVATQITMEREYDVKKDRFLNAYQIKLTADGRPLSGKVVEFWCAARNAPGYSSYSRGTIAERMKAGGTLVHATTDESGVARVTIPEFDSVTDRHLSYQCFARFNADRTDLEYGYAATPQCEVYASSHGNTSQTNSGSP